MASVLGLAFAASLRQESDTYVTWEAVWEACQLRQVWQHAFVDTLPGVSMIS